MGAEMDPQMTILTTPDADTPVLELVSAGSGDPDQVDIDQIDTDGALLSDTGLADGEAASGETAVALLPTNTPLAEPPAPTEIAPAPTETATTAPTATLVPTATSTDIPTEAPTKLPTAKPTSLPTTSSTLSPTLSPTREPAATATIVQTVTPKSTVAKSSTSGAADGDAAVDGAVAKSNRLILQPTATSASGSAGGTGGLSAAALVPSATPEPTATVYEYTVKSGDTLLRIAQQFDVSVEALMAANNIAPDEVYVLRVGQTLNVLSDDEAPLTQRYTIRAGDTFMVIAGRFGISTAALQSANGFSDEQIRLLSPGQELIIPLDSGSGSSAAALATTATASPAVAQTKTPAPTAIPTSIPTATTSPLRLDAPVLRSPENNTVVSCQSNGVLAWESVNFVTPTDEYVMYLGFVNNIDAAGNEGVTWVLNQRRPANRTSWEMDPDLCGLAPQEYGRQWRWYVEIVDEGDVVVSPSSETWGFSWN